MVRHRRVMTMPGRIFDIVHEVIEQSKCEWATKEMADYYVAKLWNPKDTEDFNVFIFANKDDKEFTFFTTIREVLITDVDPEFVNGLMNHGMICKTRDAKFLEQFCRLHFPERD